MRLGGVVFGWKDAEDWAKKHIEKGYGAAYWPLGPEADRETEDAFAAAAKRHNIVIAEVGGWCNLLAQDPAEREKNIRYDIERMKTAERVGALCSVNISGSHDAQWDAPHKDNITEATFAEVVATARRIIDESGAKRAFFCYEPMPCMFPTGTEDTQRLIKAVDRPNFGVHVDMANMMNHPQRVYHNVEFTREYLTSFACRIHSIHAKDTRVEKKLTMHIQECEPGTGEYDFANLLKLADGIGGVCVMLEHMQTEEEFDRATAFMKKTAAENGLTFEMPEA